MSEKLMENLEELQIYLRNSIQEIIICKHKENEELYLVNTIFDTNILDDVDLEHIKKDIIGVEEISQSEDGIKIFTKYFFHPSLKDTIEDADEFPLEKQMKYTIFVLDKLLKLKHLPLSVLDSLFNTNHLLVDDKDQLQMLGSIIINPEHDKLAVQDIFKRIGNILHLIYSGDEIEDGKIDEDMPPDIRKMITNCINNHYFSYEELVSDFKASSVYKLLNPESEEGQKIHQIRKSLKSKRRFHSLKKNGAKLAIIFIILLPFIVFAGGKVIDFAKNKMGNNNDTHTVDKENDLIQYEDDVANEDGLNYEEENHKNNDDIQKNQNSTEEEEQQMESSEIEDEMMKFYNDKMFEVGALDQVGILDDYHKYKGTHSIKVSNEEDQSRTTLVGVVDLNDDGFSFLKNRKSVDVSMWIRSNSNLDTIITLKLIGDEKILSQVSKDVNIPSMIWTLHSLGVNTTNVDYIKIYVTPKGVGDLWIDSVQAEILK